MFHLAGFLITADVCTTSVMEHNLIILRELHTGRKKTIESKYRSTHAHQCLNIQTYGLWNISWTPGKHAHARTNIRRSWTALHLLNNVLRGLLPQGNDKPCSLWYRRGLIIRCLCNHMETASHSFFFFIRPFIAVIAEGGHCFMNYWTNFVMHMYILRPHTAANYPTAVARQNKCPPLGYLVS